MLPCRLFGTGVALVGAVLLTTAFVSQDKGKDAGKAKPAAAPTGAPAMDPDLAAKMGAFMMPGPEHKVLDPLIGKWSTHVKWSMDPAGPAMESDGTSEFKWIMGGRYVHQDAKGSTMMGP